MQTIEVNSFAEIEQEFLERTARIVWCNVATVDTQQRPRSRILHPLWEGAIGWIGTRPNTLKAKHLSSNGYVSLAYVGDIAKPVYADCRAEWVEDMDTKHRVWEMISTTPPPLGYDMAAIFQSVDHAGYGLLKLTPWRIEVADFPAQRRVWHAQA